MEDKLRENFEKFYESKKGELNEQELKESFYLFYLQGHLDPTPVGQDISSEEVAAEIERNCFLDFIQSCIEDPESLANEAPSKVTDFVEVEYPVCEPETCTPEDRAKCVSWPDHCEDVQRMIRRKSKRIINLSKLCGVDEGKSILIKDKDQLTPTEAKLLSKAITEYINHAATLEAKKQ
jgi:hypothetical protein